MPALASEQGTQELLADIAKHAGGSVKQVGTHGLSCRKLAAHALMHTIRTPLGPL